MAAKFPPCPTNLKPIAHYLNVAQEHGMHKNESQIIGGTKSNSISLPLWIQSHFK